MSRRMSWGRVHRYAHEVWQPHDPAALQSSLGTGARRSLLAYGLGRSYGDSCLNADGVLVDMTGLDNFLAFDATRGLLHVEAGVRLADIINLLARHAGEDGAAWFLPVSPGTSFVTVGGAVANDVHGKNHHGFGTFGAHISALRLLRSDGGIYRCADNENAELFAATIGGLGLTGIILDAEIRLRRVPGLGVDNEDIRFNDLETFYALSAEAVDRWEYTVAWIDCLASGRALGRGVFSRANHRPGPIMLPTAGTPRLTMPIEPPVSPLNRLSIAAFNALYWRRFWPRRYRRQQLPVTTVLYPLDHIAGWNRLYGRRGFYQYQCVLPPENAPDAIRELLMKIADAGEGSFLAVLKTLGDRPSPGLLSFPRPGTTLALDFSNRGAPTLALLDALDAITSAAGGRLYPAKDGRMSAQTLRCGYPELNRFCRQIDPAFSSSFARRTSLVDDIVAVAA